MITRTVVLDQPAQQTIDAGIAEFPGLAEVYRSLEWRVSRNPEAGQRIPKSDPPAYVMRSKEWVTTPSLVLLYRFDENTVTVLRARIRTLEAAADDEGASEKAS